ncbi:hypothetical protein VitviT2T_011922 [Vitis vinifera]|uniref:Uncharacterized protein n=1 Tax=Vitis vinifera TaxID=29760 RepID=A0ABY9CC62_VITVI|nr:uncharacterized protein LOC104880011 [Vitis vinifera]WJZ92952.1 hypothetical protein VitviT2T_011922 [Vitis vinifera]|eukprot:XP_010653342.1 PREDICTED: uncharacterized protein LOC104880011 [Vitis vinifera]
MQANQEQQKQPWSLQVHAKAKNFNFKLKATQIIPSHKFFRLSVFLKVCSFSLKARSERGPPASRQHRTPLRSKFARILEKIRSRGTKKPAISAVKTSSRRRPEAKLPQNQRPKRFAYEEPIYVGSIMMRGLAFLSRSVSVKDHSGIIIHTSIILLYLALLFKKYTTRETSNLLATLIAAIVGCSLVFDMSSGLNYNGGLVSECVWTICNLAASSGCLYVFSQVIFSRFFQYMKALR